MSTRKLLGRYAELLNSDPRKAARFVAKYRDNTDFVELAELARLLRKALRSQSPGSHG